MLAIGLSFAIGPIGPIRKDRTVRIAGAADDRAARLTAMERRIYGLENEYGVTCTLRGQRRLSPDEVARYLFRRVVSWGRSSNVFLQNGARLYLDVGSHPEYATPECDSLYELVVHDKAGERILESLVESAEQRLAEESIRGTIYLFKNNTDSAGNSYGCHENYCTSRHDDLGHYAEVLIPFLVSRQIYAGAGKVLHTARGATYSIAQRAEHIWEGVSSATTRSRPIINTRDEPHADAERYRRLHVIVGDSNMCEYTTFLKVGAAACMLRMLEDRSVVLRDMTLENPIRAIREISHDPTCRRTVRLGNGREVSAIDIQREYLDRALRYADTKGFPPLEQRALEMWEHCVTTIENDPLKLDREVDWVIKYKLLEAFRERHGLPFGHPRVQLLDLQYHDVSRARSPFYKLQDRGHGRAPVHRRRHRDGHRRPAADDAGPPARRVRPPGQGAQARLHRRLGAPQAQRPGPAHRAVQGPVQEPRRAGREADRVVVTESADRAARRRGCRHAAGRRPPDGVRSIEAELIDDDDDASAHRRRAARDRRRRGDRRRRRSTRTTTTRPTTARPAGAGRSSTGSSSSASPCSWRSSCGRSCSPTSSSTARRWSTTLHDGDRVFVNKLSYRLHDPNRGDVVVLHQITGASERDLIKRVIALPGETIEVRSCQVLIDGRVLEEPYLDPEVVTPGNCGGELAPVTVPDDHVFVMGDNRGGSQDSRALGPIDEDDLVGRAFVVFWPQRRLAVALAGSAVQTAAELGAEGVDHHVDVIAEDAVDAHPQRRAHDVLELHVPAEADPLEAVEQRRQPAGPVGVVEVDGVDAGSAARVAARRSGPSFIRCRRVELTSRTVSS